MDAGKRIGILLGSLFLAATCIAIRYYWGAETASADPAGQPARVDAKNAAPNRSASVEKSSAVADAPSEPSIPAVVATVNTQKISREDLYRECLRHYGKEVLESMVNKNLIMQECRRQGITVTRAEVDAEVERLAKQFNIPKKQWLTMLKQERNVTPVAI